MVGESDPEKAEALRREREAPSEERACILADREIRQEAQIRFDSFDHPDQPIEVVAGRTNVIGRASLQGTREFLTDLKRALWKPDGSKGTRNFLWNNRGIERNIVLLHMTGPGRLAGIERFLDDLLAKLPKK